MVRLEVGYFLCIYLEVYIFYIDIIYLLHVYNYKTYMLGQVMPRSNIVLLMAHMYIQEFLY